jgi:hypothetical protein
MYYITTQTIRIFTEFKRLLRKRRQISIVKEGKNLKFISRI